MLFKFETDDVIVTVEADDAGRATAINVSVAENKFSLAIRCETVSDQKIWTMSRSDCSERYSALEFGLIWEKVPTLVLADNREIMVSSVIAEIVDAQGMVCDAAW